MPPGQPMLLIVLLAGCTQVSEAESCYGSFEDTTGHCLDFIGDDVTQEDCCLNLKYGFKRDEDSPCEACYPAEWSQWSPWGPCSVTCTDGVQQRKRVCYGQGDCGKGSEKLEARLETRACSLQDCCPEDGAWSAWSPWSACSVTCEIGSMERTRECNNPRPACGGTCKGEPKEIAQCDTAMVCPTHGGWNSWGQWSECSQSCIHEGSGIFPTQVRRRQCNNPEPSSDPPGTFCAGPQQEPRDCSTLPFCPVAGQWGEWQQAGECSVTCGVGRITDTRLCNNPAPRHNGPHCIGSDTRTKSCNTGVPCPIDGRWTEWSKWEPCIGQGSAKISCTKRVGSQSRTRRCNDRDFGGKACSGSTIEIRPCYSINNCKGNIEKTFWSEWSEWSLCKPLCGPSTRSRFKSCEPVLPDYPMTVGIQVMKQVFFWGSPLILCDELNGQRRKLEEKEPCHNVVACEDVED
ncbi:properdin [Ambystoma mexicanum]|uniref:properdin n=1 Tax=Ambystoma mexicanum TaxID=8296 RepID=UPI0037E81345